MRSLVFLLIALHTSFSCADGTEALRVVAERGGVVITLQDIDTAVGRIPAADKAAVVAGGDRLNQILDTELLNRQAAQRGREMKLLENPQVQRMIARAADQELAKITLERIVENSPKRDFGALAKEYYVANQAEFSTPATSVVQHIMISKASRTASETLLRVNEVIEKAGKKGVTFDELVSQYSDDPAKSENGGTFSVSEPGAVLKPLEDAAHALKSAGDISPPVETEHGTHILRLVSRTEALVEPFDLVKEGVIAKLEEESLNAVRTKFFSDLRAATPVFHEDMIEVVRKRYGELPKIGAQSIAAPPAPAIDGTK